MRNKLPREIRLNRFYPQDVELLPTNEGKVILTEEVAARLCMLFGHTAEGSRRVDATEWNTLLVSTLGSAYTAYAVKTGNQPAAYNAVDLLTALSGFFHRWDILVETQEAIISFYDSKTSAWMGSIPLPLGYHSLEVTSTSCRIAQRSVAGGTYTIVGFQ